MSEGPPFRYLPHAFKVLADQVGHVVWDLVRSGERLTVSYPMLRTYQAEIFLVVDVLPEHGEEVSVSVSLDLELRPSDTGCTS